ncbi:preprotein translocase subunit SecG [Pseudomonadota bacterium]
METILVVVHVLLAVGLIGLILIQHGKGADAGAAFGSGSSSTVFGAQGSASFLSRTTGALAALFFLTSMALAYFAMQTTEPKGLMDMGTAAPGVTVPASEVPVSPEAPVAAQDSEVPVVPMEAPAPEGN